MTDSQKHLIYRLAIITILILAVYGNTLKNGFVWDDTEIIVDNPLLEKIGNIPRLLLAEDRFAEASTGYYRPVTYLSFALDRAVWGLNPVGYDLTNIVLHILAALLFYGVVSALFKRDNLAFVAALLFALHPVVGETVNFHAGGRNTLLSACFALLAFLCYINRKYLPALASFTIAIFSKEFALLLPVMFVVYDRFIATEKRSWPSYLPYVLPIICYLSIRSHVVQQGNLFKSIQLSDNLLLIPRIVITYLKNMIVPFNLKVLYDIPIHASLFSVGIYALILMVLTAAVLYFRNKKEVLFSAIWFSLFLLPVTNIFPLGAAMIADRYAYFSLMGFCVLLAYCICIAPKQVAIAIMVGLCACYAFTDFNRNGLWRDDRALFTQMTLDAPGKTLGFQNLGLYYYNNGDLVKAEQYLAGAFANKDVSYKTVHTLAALYWETERVDKALELMLKEIKIEPDDPQVFIMLSRIYERKGDKALARMYHDKAESLLPNIEKIMTMRAGALCREGEQLLADHKSSDADRKFREALMMKPDFVPALIDMGSIAAEQGNLAKALEYFTRATDLAPLNPSGHYNLSLTYELMGRITDAQEEMKKFGDLDSRSKQQGNAVHNNR
jgi:protein O-mannosyl-transferase